MDMVGRRRGGSSPARVQRRDGLPGRLALAIAAPRDYPARIHAPARPRQSAQPGLVQIGCTPGMRPDSTLRALCARRALVLDDREAEEYFGVVITDRDAERMTAVGDYLGYIRLSLGKTKPSAGSSPQSSWSKDPMWDRQVDA